MSVDLFGRWLVQSKETKHGPSGIGFNLTSQGDYDIEDKRLCNVENPKEPKDAVNLTTIRNLKNPLNEEIEVAYEALGEVRTNAESINTRLEKLTAIVDENVLQIIQLKNKEELKFLHQGQ